MLQAGKLNRKVKIQSRGETQDEIGQPIEGWVDFATVWANIAAKSGLETASSDTDVSAARYSIRIRYRPAVAASMRVLHGTRTYRIDAVLHDEAKREHTDLVCEAVETDG